MATYRELLKDLRNRKIDPTDPSLPFTFDPRLVGHPDRPSSNWTGDVRDK